MSYIKGLIFLLVSITFCISQDIKYETKYFDTLLDHFDFTTDTTFKLRYLENNTYWKPDDGNPIFFYTGNEGDVTLFANNTGFLWEIAPEFNALIIFAEHRYYGSSLPFGNNSFLEPKYSGYLSSSQALRDYVALISYIKQSYNVSSDNNPVIAFGGSYGGMLAAWMRMKYPAVIQGSLASSAPIWQFTGMTPCYEFNKVATSSFAAAGEDCAKSIKKSWDAINKKGETENGRSWLTTTFKLCEPLKNGNVDAFKDWMSDVYINLAMTNYPYETNFLAPLPANPVKAVCKYLLESEVSSDELLRNIFTGLSLYFNGTGSATCLNLDDSATPSLGQFGWNYQSCTEMVMPMCDNGESMFERAEWNMETVSQNCFEQFKVRPQERLVEQEYGGKNIQAASNIIFSNGLLDPWSSGGVLHKVSKTVDTIVIPESAHHLDLRFSNSADPFSIRKARKYYKRTFKAWIASAPRTQNILQRRYDWSR